jgi:hypothetical protein
MRKILVFLLFVFLSFVGKSQTDDVFYQQVCVFINIISVEEENYIVVDFIEGFDENLNEINNINTLTTFEITSISELFDLTCIQVDFKTFSSKNCLINSFFLCSIFNNSLIGLSPIDCMGE